MPRQRGRRTFATMAYPSIRPFTAADLPAAARLLAERHANHRRTSPLLSPRYEDEATTLAEVSTVWQTEGASGSVAVDGTEVVGYLLGAPKASPVWGPNIWVEAAGMAAGDAETMRDLYGAAASRWFEEGKLAHYALVPTDEGALVDAWFRLGFGAQHAHAVMAPPTEPLVHPDGLVVRQAERRDIDVLAELELALPAHQGLSPVFSAGQVGTLEEARKEWEEDIESEYYASFVAERDGRLIGSAVGCPLEKSSTHVGLARPDHAAILAFAAVFPDARGSGAGQALARAVGSWAASDGFEALVTDWRVTNLLSSRTWPKLGYRQTFLRVHRHLGF